MMTVRTRFAPSPTGYLHLGGVRTALFNWLFARQHGGQFVLRIDDTDQQRNVPAALAPILHGLKWLGIDWDEGPEMGGPHAPYCQSERADGHRAAVQQLLESGHAYRDYATPEEMQQERKTAEQGKGNFHYSRRWLAETDEQAAQFEASGRQAVVRLKMPRTGTCRFVDLVWGEVSFPWAQEADHVVARTDGSCLYHLASVVDDRALNISHVIRAVEHLSNTPRQIFIAQSLGMEVPRFAHLPYVAEPGSQSKLSKRKIPKYLKQGEFRKIYEHAQQVANALDLATVPETFNPVVVDFYEQVGYLPQAMVNYLLLLGWSLDDKTEFFTRSQMIEKFSLDRVNRAPASFDPVKLGAFQEAYMRQLPAKQKVVLVLPYLQRAHLVSMPASCDVGPRLKAIVEAAGDRLKVAGDILEYAAFFQPDNGVTYDEKAFNKRLRTTPDAIERLARFRLCLAEVEPFAAEKIEQALKIFVESEGVKISEVIHSLRIAVTGQPVGFGLFESLVILGKGASLRRIDRTLSLV